MDNNNRGKSPCCRSKVDEVIEPDSAPVISFNSKVRSVPSLKNASTDSLARSTESNRYTAPSKKKDLKGQLSDEFANEHVDHSPGGLIRYQKEIERKCDDRCPTKKAFTLDIVQKYSEVETSKKIDLATIVHVKAVHPDAPCPYAIDAECYSTFQDFFHPIILDLQNIVDVVDSSQGLDFGEMDLYEDLDLNADKEVLRVMYCEIIVRRNLNEFNLAGFLKTDSRNIVKDTLKAKFRELFASLSPVTIPNEWITRLKECEPYLFDARAMCSYPKGRLNMVYKDDLDCNIGCIINYDDHLQLVLSTNNGKIGHIYNQANKILNSTIMYKMEFMKSQKYGYITYSPQYLGTGFTIRLVLRFHFICLMDDVEDLYLKDLGLSVKNIDEPSKGLIILSNSKTLGITEIDTFNNVLEGYRRLYELDTELKNTSPYAVIDKTMPVESMATLVGKINACESARTYTKKYLTEIITHQYDNISTSFNGLFNHCIRANAFYPKSLFPKACDSDCYSAFSRFFNPIILEANHCRQFLHNTGPNYGIAKKERRFKFQHNLIKGYRVRFSRNLEDYPFPMLMSSTERKEIEAKLIAAFQRFPKELSGTYYKLEDIWEAKEFNFLQDLHLIPKANNPIKRASWVYRDWPKNRGIFLATKDPNHPYNVLIILVNEVDHFQVSCINYFGLRLDHCYDRAVLAMQCLDITFCGAYSKKPNYGFLSSNPQNIGCCMRVGAKIFLKYLGNDKLVLNEFCILNNMNYRGIYGSGSRTKDNIFDISLKLNLNYSEVQILMLFVQRLKDLILEERTYDHSIPKPINFQDSVESFSPVFVKVSSSETTSAFSDSSTVETTGRVETKSEPKNKNGKVSKVTVNTSKISGKDHVSVTKTDQKTTEKHSFENQ